MLLCNVCDDRCVRLSARRWWPCEICHPRNVPDNVLAMQHDVGEFAVRYFGTNEYYWTHQGRSVENLSQLYFNVLCLS